MFVEWWWDYNYNDNDDNDAEGIFEEWCAYHFPWHILNP